MSRPFCAGGAALDRWLTANGQTQRSFAATMGIGHAVLWRWMVGDRTPHIDAAARLEQLTSIPATTWATTEELRPATGTEG